MPKYQSKPVIADAVQWNGFSDIPSFPHVARSLYPDDKFGVVEGQRINPGDYIIQAANGLLVVNQEAFERDFEILEPL